MLVYRVEQRDLRHGPYQYDPKFANQDDRYLGFRIDRRADGNRPAPDPHLWRDATNVFGYASLTALNAWWDDHYEHELMYNGDFVVNIYEVGIDNVNVDQDGHQLSFNPRLAIGKETLLIPQAMSNGCSICWGAVKL